MCSFKFSINGSKDNCMLKHGFVLALKILIDTYVFICKSFTKELLNVNYAR